MKKIVINICIVFALAIIFLPCKVAFCNSNTNTVENQIINSKLEGKLVELKKNQLRSIQDYTVKYGSEAFGIVAYILNFVRIYSIPVCFIGIVIGAVKQYILGIRKLDTLEQGMVIILSSITVLTICQVLPLLFAIVVKFGKG